MKKDGTIVCKVGTIACKVNNYIVRSYRVVIVVTNIVTMRTIKESIIVM